MVWAVLNKAQNAALQELVREQQSDRVVAIVGGAMLDDSLRQALESRLRPHEDTNNKLFKTVVRSATLGRRSTWPTSLYIFEKLARDTMRGSETCLRIAWI
jgi:predicted NBD/HSP70 family sugar kinase